MTAYVVILIVGAGYLSGFVLVSGLLMSALRKDLADKKSTLGLKIWPIFAVVNWLLAVFGFSFVGPISTVGNDGSFSSAKIILFTIGFMLSASFGLYVCHRIDKRYKVWGESQPGGG